MCYFAIEKTHLHFFYSIISKEIYKLNWFFCIKSKNTILEKQNKFLQRYRGKETISGTIKLLFWYK